MNLQEILKEAQKKTFDLRVDLLKIKNDDLERKAYDYENNEYEIVIENLN